MFNWWFFFCLLFSWFFFWVIWFIFLIIQNSYYLKGQKEGLRFLLKIIKCFFRGKTKKKLFSFILIFHLAGQKDMYTCLPFINFGFVDELELSSWINEAINMIGSNKKTIWCSFLEACGEILFKINKTSLRSLSSLGLKFRFKSHTKYDKNIVFKMKSFYFVLLWLFKFVVVYRVIKKTWFLFYSRFLFCLTHK